MTGLFNIILKELLSNDISSIIKFTYVDTSMLHNDAITNRVIERIQVQNIVVHCQYLYIKTLYLLKSYLAVVILYYQH